MNAPSKMVVDRQRSTLDIASLLSQNTDTLAAGLAHLFDDELIDSEAFPDLALLQTLMTRRLRRRLDTLIDLDRAHIDHHTDELPPRRHRDRSAALVRERLLLLRQAAHAHFGDRALELIPIVTTAYSPEALWRQAHHTLERLTNPDHPLPPTAVQGLPTDLRPWIHDLESANIQLRQALDNLSAARARTLHAQQAKSANMVRLDREVRSIVRALEGLYRLIERDDLAAKVRVPLRRKRETVAREVAETVEPAEVLGGDVPNNQEAIEAP
ncbi:MAG: hypothetical protein AAGD38_05605 [Acidobacteriota bacterium]